MTTHRIFRTLSAALIGGSMLAVLATPSLAEVVIRRGNGGEPQTLDQAHISIDVEGFIVRDMFEGLTIYDPHGKVIPGVAESWTLSDDGTVYTFKLREAANWSDGKPVTANDFVFAYRRMEDPKEAAEYANILYPIKNAEAINGGKAAVDTLGCQGHRRQDPSKSRSSARPLISSSCSPITPHCRRRAGPSRSPVASGSSRAISFATAPSA